MGSNRPASGSETDTAASESEPFGDILSRFRRVAGLTQEQLAERAGLSVRAISDLERGAAHGPQRQTVRLLARALDLSTQDEATLERASDRRRGLRSSIPDTGRRGRPAPPALPQEPSPFIGRQGEVTAVCALVQSPGIRLITLVGAGGTGKTRLAIRAGRELQASFADGVYFVALASVDDAALVLPAIARVLGIRELGRDNLTELVTAHLAAKRTLLILDNVEHLLEAGPRLASLLEACPDLTLLVTSRAVLHLRQEQVFEVPPLTVPERSVSADTAAIRQVDAVALFLERANAAGADVTFDDAAMRATAEICRRLDGLPLALELAAARVRAFSPQTLLDRISQGLDILSGGPRDAPLRHRTVRNAIDWSYGLLSRPERTLFTQLSVFAGGWSLEAAEALGTDEQPRADLLASLVDQSLVTVQLTPFGMEWYRFLDPVRQFAIERLGEGQEAEEARRRHADYYLQLGEQAERELTGAHQLEWLDRLEAEYYNLRTALTWWLNPRHGDSAGGLRLGTALWRFWYITGRWREGRTWLERGLEASGGQIPSIRARALLASGTSALFQGEYAGAETRLRESLALYRQLGDEQCIASALTYLGFRATFAQDREAVHPIVAEAEEVRLHLADRLTLAYLDIFLSIAAFTRGDLDRARLLSEEALSLSEQLDDRRGICLCFSNLGLLALVRGEEDRAKGLFSENLHLARRSRDVLNAQYSLLGLAALAARHGRAEHAARLWGAAAALRQVHGLHLTPLIRSATEYDRDMTLVRGALGDAAFDRAWTEGEVLTPEQIDDIVMADYPSTL